MTLMKRNRGLIQQGIRNALWRRGPWSHGQSIGVTDPELVAALVAMRRAGLTLKAIAAASQLSTATVTRYLVKAGVWQVAHRWDYREALR